MIKMLSTETQQGGSAGPLCSHSCLHSWELSFPFKNHGDISKMKMCLPPFCCHEPLTTLGPSPASSLRHPSTQDAPESLLPHLDVSLMPRPHLRMPIQPLLPSILPPPTPRKALSSLLWMGTWSISITKCLV